MELTRFKAISAIPVFVAVSMPGSAVSEAVIPSVSNVEYSHTDSLGSDVIQGTPTQQSTTITVRQAPTEWTKKMAKRFEELAILEATGKISSAQRTELEELSFNRRNLQFPRSPDEVLREFRQRQVTSALVEAVRAYAKFHSV